MKNFLYEYYRIYPNQMTEGYFKINDYHYVLLECQIPETDLTDLIMINQHLSKRFEKENVLVLKTIYQKYTSTFDDRDYILICFKEREVSLEELLEMNLRVTYNHRIDLKTIQALWEKKTDFIESTYLPSLNIKDSNYERLVAITSFYLGIAENAIEYLVDTMYDFMNVEMYTYLTHKRINRYNVFELYNPLNYVFDSKIRDISEMFKYSVLDIDLLQKILPEYQLNNKEIHYLMARLLFPTNFFDLIEKNYYERTNIDEEILEYYHKIHLEELKIKKIYYILNQYMPLRPIDWLLK